MTLPYDTPPHLVPIMERIDVFHAREVAPREKRLEHRLTNSLAYVDENGLLHPQIQQARREIMSASAQAGLWALHLPASVGGGGLSRTEMFFVEEHVYAKGVGLAPAILSWTDGASPRLIFCNPAQRARFADPLVRGEATCAHAVTEPHAGSNIFDLQTRAIRKGSKWVLNGHKALITNPFYADIINVLAVTDPGAGRRSFSYFQLETREYLGRGLRHGRVNRTMFDDGLTGELHFDDLELDDDLMLGERGQGFDIALTSINWTRTRRGGMCCAWSKLLIDKSLERLKTRRVGGKPLGRNQGLQWMISDMYTDWYATRATCLAALREIESHGPWYKTDRTPQEIRLFAVMKIVADEAFYRVADKALQLHGGFGVIKDNVVNKLFQIARNLRIPGGTDESQRNTIAETLGLRVDME